MGSKYSTPAKRSPSAAFGRLRIDSPKARLHHHRSERASPGQQQQRDSRASFTSLRNISLRDVGVDFVKPPLTEQSPLVRHLESLPSDVSVGIPPPWWIVPALICALCYALYNIFIKLGSASIHPILGGVVLQFVAAILGTVLLSFLIWKDGVEDLNYDFNGVKWAICAGIAVGLAEMLSFCVSGLGVPASKSIPIIIGGSVGFGCFLGLLVLQEMLGIQGWVGVAMIVVGVGLVGTDPYGPDVH